MDVHAVDGNHLSGGRGLRRAERSLQVVPAVTCAEHHVDASAAVGTSGNCRRVCS